MDRFVSNGRIFWYMNMILLTLDVVAAFDWCHRSGVHDQNHKMTLHLTLVKMCKYWRDLCYLGGICAKIVKNVQKHVQNRRDGCFFSLCSIYMFALKTRLFDYKAGWRDGKNYKSSWIGSHPSVVYYIIIGWWFVQLNSYTYTYRLCSLTVTLTLTDCAA